MYIEFENTERQQTEQQANNRNPSQPYHVATQAALLFTEGSKYPDKFDYMLYRGLDVNLANAAQPMPAGKYELKEGAHGVNGFRGINCDYSLIVPMKSAARAA